MPAIKISDKLSASEESRLQWLRDCMTDWLKMTDIKEFLIVAKVKSGGMRFQMPVKFTDDFWWVGALENLKSVLNNRLNDTAHNADEHSE